MTLIAQHTGAGLHIPHQSEAERRHLDVMHGVFKC